MAVDTALAPVRTIVNTESILTAGEPNQWHWNENIINLVKYKITGLDIGVRVYMFATRHTAEHRRLCEPSLAN